MQSQRKQPLLASLLVALMLLQQSDLFACHHQQRAWSATASGAAAAKRIPSPQPRHDPSGDDDKRSNLRAVVSSSAGVVGGRPEEIFYAGDHMESNYDEYPMVVPKRGDLLLNRLMMALHRALAKERLRSGDLHRNELSQFRFNDKNDLGTAETVEPAAGIDEDNAKAATTAATADENTYTVAQPFDAGNIMYSDDDPSIMMDYDFKDLNAINRATGETLMGKGFQRRANMGVQLGDESAVSGIAMLRAAPPAVSGEASAGVYSGSGSGGSGGGGGGGGGHKNAGRLYWRCYFNAVSCF